MTKRSDLLDMIFGVSGTDVSEEDINKIEELLESLNKLFNGYDIFQTLAALTAFIGCVVGYLNAKEKLDINDTNREMVRAVATSIDIFTDKFMSKKTGPSATKNDFTVDIKFMVRGDTVE